MDHARHAETQRIDNQRIARLCGENALHILMLGMETHPDISFDRAGIEWLDDFIEVSRPQLGTDNVDEFVNLVGCFYGECLIAALGGSWVRSGRTLGVVLSEHEGTIPFVAVARQVCGEPDFSIAAAFHGAIEYFTPPAIAA